MGLRLFPRVLEMHLLAEIITVAAELLRWVRGRSRYGV